MTKSSPHKHVAVLAFSFGSHALSLLTLVRKLAKAAPNVHFSFLNTQKSNHSLFSTAKPDEILPNIKAYDVADGVPAGHVLSPNPIEAVELFIKYCPKFYIYIYIYCPVLSNICRGIQVQETSHIWLLFFLNKHPVWLDSHPINKKNT